MAGIWQYLLKKRVEIISLCKFLLHLCERALPCDLERRNEHSRHLNSAH